MKIFNVIIFFTTFMFGINLCGQYQILTYKECNVEIDTSFIKNINEKLKFTTFYNNRLNLHKYDSILLGSLCLYNNINKEYFFTLNANDSNIYIYKDLFFSNVGREFIFKSKLYFVADRGKKKTVKHV